MFIEGKWDVHAASADVPRAFNSRIDNPDHFETVVEFIPTSILQPSSILRSASLIMTSSAPRMHWRPSSARCFIWRMKFVVMTSKNFDPLLSNGTVDRCYQLSNAQCDKPLRCI
jgi:hypothetical protein